MQPRREQTWGETRAASPHTPLREQVKVLRVGPPSGRGRYQRVTLDGGTTLRVRAEDVTALGIAPGAELDGEGWALVRRRAQSAGALESALRLLRVRLRSRGEIEDRLASRGYPADVIGDVVTRLEREGFLDDLRFSRAWIAGRMAVRPSGVVRLRRELRQKGVPAALIEQAIRTELSGSSEHATALALARSRVRTYRGEPREVAFRRLAGVLQRRGFSTDAIMTALREIFGRTVPTVE